MKLVRVVARNSERALKAFAKRDMAVWDPDKDNPLSTKVRIMRIHDQKWFDFKWEDDVVLHVIGNYEGETPTIDEPVVQRRRRKPVSVKRASTVVSYVDIDAAR